MEDQSEDGRAKGAAQLRRDPSGDAGVRDLVGLQAQVGPSHDGDGHRSEAGTTDHQGCAEKKLIGVHSGLRIGESAGHREKKANKHDGSSADAVGQPARIASGQEHPQALRGEEQPGGEGALAAHLLLVEGEQQHRSVYRQTQRNSRTFEAVKDRTANSRRSRSGQLGAERMDDKAGEKRSADADG